MTPGSTQPTQSESVSGAARLADVAVPLPLPKSFTYKVPRTLQALIAPGVRVEVPFGRGKVVGLVLQLLDAAEDVKQLRSVTQVMDAEPLLTPQLLKLGRWVSEYYLAPPGETFRSMLPPGLLARKTAEVERRGRVWPVRRQLAIVDARHPEKAATARQREIMTELVRCSLPQFASHFARRVGCTLDLLKRMAARGCLHLQEVEVERSPWDRPPPARVEPHVLTPDQAQVLKQIQRLAAAREFRPLLLHGVTGSGKTEIYLNAIRSTMEAGRSALMLVPEIGLTPQVSRWFRGWFGNAVAILHSGLSTGERFDQWRRIQRGDCKVVVGTRSAVFAPLQDLGILIVDEEHDESYKQEEQPRYHGRDTGLMRARLEGAAVILGSATPQLETYFLATEKKRYHFAAIISRVLERPLPSVHIVDMRQEFARHGREQIFSGLLQEYLARTLSRRQQALVLLNRRGYSAAVLCRSCGYVETCENCSVTLTHHRELNRLSCHYCGYSRSVPNRCRQCNREYVFFVGMGTEKIQAHLRALYPEARIARLDRDTARRKGSLRNILRRFARGDTDILVGTQMIAKGHDFPNVTLVGVLSADKGLQVADFRSAERTFQLLTQVAGRAGRGESAGDVVIQTYYPNHYSLKYACTQDYGAFYGREIEFRRRFRYPPFTALANLVLSGSSREGVRRNSARLAEALKDQRTQCSNLARMRILGPAPAVLERLKRDYRYQILIKSTDRQELHQVLSQTLESLPASLVRRVQVDIDPVRLL